MPLRESVIIAIQICKKQNFKQPLIVPFRKLHSWKIEVNLRLTQTGGNKNVVYVAAFFSERCICMYCYVEVCQT